MDVRKLLGDRAGELQAESPFPDRETVVDEKNRIGIPVLMRDSEAECTSAMME